MFGLIGTQWKVTKAVSEIVDIAGERGLLRREMLDQMTKQILSLSRDIGISRIKLLAEQQAMVAVMVFFGTMGSTAFEDSSVCCDLYAERHGVAEAVVEEAKAVAAAIAQKMAEAEGSRS